MRTKNRFLMVGATAMAFLAAACSDLLEVQDPGNFTDEDLDKALEAVADGVEGLFHSTIDNVSYTSALLGDEFQHTGTWAQWDDVDHGRIRYAQSSTADGLFNGLMQARFASQDAQDRFTRVLEGAAATSPLMARVQVVEGMIDLVTAEHFCEAPAGQATAAISDNDLYAQAITKLTNARNTANAAALTDYATVATAGLARAYLFTGQNALAASEAATVPTDFTYEAVFTLNALQNGTVNLATVGFNNAGGMREKWWAQVDTDAGLLMDAFTGELDPRVPIVHAAGVVGVDGITPHYSQFKFTEVGSDIEIIGGREMRLIEAEVAWAAGDFATAMGFLNGLRTDAGLTALANPGTSAGVFDILLNERFAENFMEGHRANDLFRFGLVDDLLAAGDFNSPTTGGTSIAARAIKFPMDDGEAINNANIDDDVAIRCSPTL